MWYETRPARFKAELDSIAALAAGQSWFKSYKPRLDRTSNALCVDVDLQVGENLRPITLAYPEAFPYTPPSIKPRGATERWSGHQYGVGGELCLEHRADNWEPQITGVEMIESVYKLLTSEDGVEQSGEPLVVESAHRSTTGQLMRLKSRFVATAAALKQIALCEKPTSATFRVTCDGDSLVFLLATLIAPNVPKWTDPELPVGITDYASGKGFVISVGLDDKRLLAMPSAGATGAKMMRDLFFGDGAPAFEETETFVISLGSAAFAFAYRLNSQNDALESLGMILPGSGKRMMDANDVLASKKVAILGAGSIGSKVAMSLARAGVRKFVLMDEDVLRSENLVRHALTWESVGHHKVKALEDTFKLLTPGVEVDSWTFDLGGQNSTGIFDMLVNAIKECDLIVDGTGSASAFNYACVIAAEYSKPMAWARVFGGGYGGMIARSRPGLEPSPQFARAVINAWCANPEFPKAPKEVTDYGVTDKDGVPMIADDADVSAIAAHFTRLVIDTLIAPEKSVFASSAYMIGLREEWIFKAAFDTRPIDLGAPHVSPPEVALPEYEAAQAANMLATLRVADVEGEP